MKIYYTMFLVAVCAACARNATIGEQYLGAKYMLDPLGEGTAPDTDPLIRFDAFDCTTFVETALANGDQEKLTKIRYKNGAPDFVNRNHFIETDWLPNNSDLVENVSNKYGKTATRTVKINRSAWLKRIHNISYDIPIKIANLEYIPYKNIGEIKNDKPLIVFFIGDKYKNTDILGTDLAVMHMGFLLPGGTILRHASSEKGQVTDAAFNEYIAKRQKTANNLGIMLLEIKK